MTERIRWAYLGVFFLAFSIILFEIAMTRVFAIMMWHHFTYMVISMALLGFGAAGSLMTARRDALRDDSPFPGLALWSTGYGVSVVLAFCFTTLVRVDSLRIWEDKSNLLALLLIYLILTVPFILGGLALGSALTRLVRHVNRLYFVDLVGSAIGAGLSVVVLQKLGNVSAVMIAGALGVLAGVFFSFGANLARRILPLAALGVMGFMAVSYSGGLGSDDDPIIRERDWPIPFSPAKDIELFPHLGPETIIPSATARVEILPEMLSPPMIGGNFGKNDLREVALRLVTQDGTAPTVLYRDGANLESFKFLDDSQAGTAYRCFGATGRREPEVLVIGVGGGVDVMVALANGCKNVTAVEINSAMIDMATNIYDDYIGGLFRPDAHPYSDKIELVHGEGRSYVARHDKRYDIIQMSGVDSFTALSTGAYTLSESYLYTTEAVKDFYGRLNDDGYINYSRFILSHPRKPRETLRLANIARKALEEMGIEDPTRHVAVFQGFAFGSSWASTIIKKGEFTEDEIEDLDRFAFLQAFRGLLFDPLSRPNQPRRPPANHFGNAEKFFEQILTTEIQPRLGQAPDGGWQPVTRQLGRAFVRYTTGRAEEAQRMEAAVVAAIAPGNEEIAGLVRTMVDRAVTEQQKSTPSAIESTRADFASLLLGSEAERRAFVESYPYDVSPCTDDAPFFFNYYKYTGMFDNAFEVKSGVYDRYHPDFPVGHWVLAMSLIQILLIAVVLLVMPIRHLAREGTNTPGKWRFLFYFSALGLGFMLVEIALMQKLVLVLGHPTYALSVVLGGILLFAGFGSLLAGRIKHLGRGTLMTMMVFVVGTILGTTWIANNYAGRILEWSLAGRIGAALALLMPLGLALGTCFPTGLRIVERLAPMLMPWCWAINGLLSVFASIFCIVLAMFVGFTNVLYAAAAIYAVGFLMMKPAPREAVEAE